MHTRACTSQVRSDDACQQPSREHQVSVAGAEIDAVVHIVPEIPGPLQIDPPVVAPQDAGTPGGLALVPDHQ